MIGISVTVTLIAAAAYRSTIGKRARDRAGEVSVHCPRCGYSMVGLERCQCPECGFVCTIDALIAAQEYDAHLMQLPSKAELPATVEPAAPSLKALPQHSG